MGFWYVLITNCEGNHYPNRWDKLWAQGPEQGRSQNFFFQRAVREKKKNYWDVSYKNNINFWKGQWILKKFWAMAPLHFLPLSLGQRIICNPSSSKWFMTNFTPWIDDSRILIVDNIWASVNFPRALAKPSRKRKQSSFFTENFEDSRLTMHPPLPK